MAAYIFQEYTIRVPEAYRFYHKKNGLTVRNSKAASEKIDLLDA
jgi:hypothetical protein